LIFKLKDDCGAWIDDQWGITDKFISYYTLHSKSTQGTNRNLVDLRLTRLILDMDNLELVRLLDIEEVKQVILSIESNKTPNPDGFNVGFFKHY